jgi:hypothetical protein
MEWQKQVSKARGNKNTTMHILLLYSRPSITENNRGCNVIDVMLSFSIEDCNFSSGKF